MVDMLVRQIRKMSCTVEVLDFGRIVIVVHKVQGVVARRIAVPVVEVLAYYIQIVVGREMRRAAHIVAAEGMDSGHTVKV